MKPPTVAAYYYPGYHRTPGRDSRGQQTEWGLLYDDVALQGYPDVRRPLAGPIETSVESLATESLLAQSYGIDAFLWCWYWDRGKLIYNEALDMFLDAVRPPGFQYALLWVNKRPHFKLPMDHVHSGASMNARLVETGEADFAAMVDHLIARHFKRDDYIRVDGKPILPIFVVEPMVRQLGAGRLARLLEGAQKQARAAGLPGICFIAVWHRLNHRRRWLLRLGLGRWAGEAALRDIGFSAISNYLFLPHWDGPAEQSYGKLVDERPAEWPQFSDYFGLPMWPSVTPGWDARVRGVPLDPMPKGHPWAPLIRDETPADFARLLDRWTAYAKRYGPVPLMPVASWNEWTEGHAIAPCTRHGDGMLRALKAWKASLSAADDTPPVERHVRATGGRPS